MPTPTKPTRLWVSGEPRPIDRLPTTYEQEREPTRSRMDNVILVVSAILSAIIFWMVLVLVIVVFGE